MVDSQNMQRRALKILIREAFDAEQRYKEANNYEGDDWRRNTANLELIESMCRVRGIAFVRYGSINTSALYRWANRYFGVPHKLDCETLPATNKK